MNTHTDFKHHFENPGQVFLANPQHIWEASVKKLAQVLDVSVKRHGLSPNCHAKEGGQAQSPEALQRPFIPGTWGTPTCASSVEMGHEWVSMSGRMDKVRTAWHLPQPEASGATALLVST